ncbi:MAG: glycosyltransferase family A protein [Candidatus Paceibacterota bacterium]
MITNRRPTTKEDHITFTIPAFNSAITIEESIDSIFNGNFEKGDEVIVVNDGSTDKTKEVVEKLQKKYSGLKLISQENKGCPAARNTAIREAKNPLIFTLYSDDILVPGTVSKVKDYLIKKQADMAGFGETHFFYTKKGRKVFTHKFVSIPGIFTLADFLEGDINPSHGGNYLYTKDIWEKVGGIWEYGKGLHEAWGFTLKVLANGAKMLVTPGTYYNHRYGYDSLTTKQLRLEDGALMATKMIEPFLDLLDKKDAEFLKSYEGSRSWFTSRDRKAIHLKSGEIGHTGKLVIYPKEKIKRSILRLLRRIPFVYNKLFPNAKIN